MERTSNAPEIKRVYGEDFFAKIGQKGGKAKVLKGMAKIKVEDPERFKAIQEKAAQNRKKS